MRVIKVIIGLFIFCVIFFGACDGTTCINNCTYSCQKSCNNRKQEKQNQQQLEKSKIDFNIVDSLNESNVYTLQGILQKISYNINSTYYLLDKDSEWIEDRLEFGGVFDGKDGYKFVGIYDTKDTSGTKIINKQFEWATPIDDYYYSHGEKKSYTFYSVWEPVKINIQFEIDASKTTNTSLNSLRIPNVNYGTKLSELHASLVNGLPVLEPSNNDYDFIGWETNNGAEVSAGDGNIIIDKELITLGGTSTELTLTFKAIFNKGKGTVVFHYGEDYNKTYNLTVQVGNTNPWNLVESTHDIKKIVDFMYWSANPSEKTQWTGRVEKNQTLHLYAITQEVKVVYLKFSDESSTVKVKVYATSGTVKTVSGNQVYTINEHNGKEVYAWYPTSELKPGEQVSTGNGTNEIKFDYNKIIDGQTYYAKYLGQ